MSVHLEGSRPMSEAVSRTLQVLRFLREFYEIRNKPVRHVRQHLDHLFAREFPVGPGCELHLAEFETPDTDAAGEAEGGASLLDAPLLTVDKQSLTTAPPPPEVLTGWLEIDGRDPEKSPRPRISRAAPTSDRRMPEEERFDADGERVAAFEGWAAQRWERWARTEAPRRRVQAFYERLYGLYLRLERDKEELELVWATGLLAWRLGAEEILHPLVLAPVDLHFDRDRGQLRIVSTTAVPQLADDIFQGVGEEWFREFTALARAFRSDPVAPWDRRQLVPFLARVANVFPRGAVVDEPMRPSLDPAISRDDVLILRKRRVGYGRDIVRWVELLEGGAEPPATVRRVVGVHGDSQADLTGPSPASDELLFPLPANAEQETIARRLAQHPGVVVQGPPGTGKSHTIANLVSHLLAHGKTILITAQTERALRVLRDKVPETIRSLCVSLTGSDVSTQQELKQSVQVVIERTGGSRERYSKAAAEARAELTRVRTDLAALWGAVARTSLAESAEVRIGDSGWTPSRAGRYLREREREDGWLPDSVSTHVDLPLNDLELDELMALATRVSRKDLVEATRRLPDVKALPSAATFRERVEHAEHLRRRLAEAGPLVHRWQPPSAMAAASLPALIDEVRGGFERALEDLAAFQTPWIQQIRKDLARIPERRDAWQRVVAELRRRREEALVQRSSLAARAVEVSTDGPVHHRIDQVKVLREYVEGGGGFGVLFPVLHGGLKRTRALHRVDGAEPSTLAEIDAVLASLRLEQLRGELVNLVANEIEPLGGPSLRPQVAAAEQAVDELISPLTRLLAWQQQTWERLRWQLRDLGCELRPSGGLHPPVASEQPRLTLEERGDEAETARAVVDLVAGLAVRVALTQHGEWRASLRADLESEVSGEGAGAVASALIEAVDQEDAGEWERGVREAERLWTLRSEALRLAALHERISSVAPRCAERFLEAAAEGRRLPTAGQVREAWRWRQVSSWLEEHLAAPTPEDLRRQIDTLKAFEADLVARLVNHSTWAALTVRDEERQALAGWQQAIARIGKGTGKRTARLKREAQALMSQARRAVPVWIMPLGKVIENFSPDGPRFDVVIVDESSQADTFGLLALLRAERAVVVGDDNQISPAAVGQRLDVVDELIDKHLRGIPNSALYDGQQSLYDLATAAFGGVIRLREHFRCVPDIIAFSNWLSYDGEIQPLRDPRESELSPAIVLERVVGFRANGSDVNEPEADRVAALVAACCQHPAYKTATIGVISLLGEDQARAILDRIRGFVSSEELEDRKFIAGDAYHFQGDERTVMFLSVVDAPGEHRSAVMNKRSDQQRFNVAASRARDQMWIVHSADGSYFHPEDMRARLLTHYAAADQRARNWREVDAALRDERYHFQRLVAAHIVERGYRVRAEVQVGQYRIDLVVEGDSDSLAVECDGERWHTLDTHADDVARQITLERLGWKFFRVRGGQYFRNPEHALAPLWRRLPELGITPGNDIAAASSSLADEVRAHADRLLREQQEAGGSSVMTPPEKAEQTPTPPSSNVYNPAPAQAKLPFFPTRVDAARPILDFLLRNPGWHKRDDMLRVIRLDEEEWRPAINDLLASGSVIKRGQTRGTEYSAASPPRPAPTAPSERGPATPLQAMPGQRPLATQVPSVPTSVSEAMPNGLEFERVRQELVRLREQEVRPAFPDVPAERGLLRRGMIDAFLRHRPTSEAEYERRMPAALRGYTDPSQLRFLSKVFAILARVS